MDSIAQSIKNNLKPLMCSPLIEEMQLDLP